MRPGSFFPSLVERCRRIDRALFAVVMEAYVHGVAMQFGQQVGQQGTAGSPDQRRRTARAGAGATMIWSAAAWNRMVKLTR